jgi:hypothetical protein
MFFQMNVFGISGTAGPLRPSVPEVANGSSTVSFLFVMKNGKQIN